MINQMKLLKLKRRTCCKARPENHRSFKPMEIAGLHCF